MNEIDELKAAISRQEMRIERLIDAIDALTESRVQLARAHAILLQRVKVAQDIAALSSAPPALTRLLDWNA